MVKLAVQFPHLEEGSKRSACGATECRRVWFSEGLAEKLKRSIQFHVV